MKKSLHDWWTPFNRQSPQFSCPIHGQPERTRTLLIAGAATFAVGMAAVIIGGRPVVGLAKAFWIVGLGLSLGGWFGIVGRVCFPRCTCEVENTEVPHG